MTDLKPCPFCGEPAEMKIVHGNYGYTPDKYIVRCTYCDARIEMTSGYSSLSKAVTAAWNRRVKDDI